MSKNIVISVVMASALGGYLAWQYFDRNDGKIGAEVVTFHERHGVFDVICDHLPSKKGSKRCYLRLADVYSERPDFGAYVGFVSAVRDDRPVFDLSFEKGTSLKSPIAVLEKDNAPIWQFDADVCDDTKCTIDADQLDDLVAKSPIADSLEFRFSDKDGRQWVRKLPAVDFANAWSDFEEISQKEGLM